MLQAGQWPCSTAPQTVNKAAAPGPQPSVLGALVRQGDLQAPGEVPGEGLLAFNRRRTQAPYALNILHDTALY